MEPRYATKITPHNRSHATSLLGGYTEAASERGWMGKRQRGRQTDREKYSETERVDCDGQDLLKSTRA